MGTPLRGWYMLQAAIGSPLKCDLQAMLTWSGGI